METGVKEVELRDLWRRYKEDGDAAARERLVVAYSPMVKFVAGRLGAGLPSHVDDADLISYGLMGLIGAIERFEPERGIKFETFAMTRIRGAIIDELRSLDWVPRSVRSRAREIEAAQAKLEHELQRAPSEAELAGEARASARRNCRPRCWRSPTPRSTRSTSSGRSPTPPATRSRCSTRSPTRAPTTRRNRSPAARSRTASPRRSPRCPSASSSSSPSTTTRTSPCARSARCSASPSRASRSCTPRR